MPTIPSRYREPLRKQFPYDIEFYIPGYIKSYPIGFSKSLSVVEINSDIWFEDFVDLVVKNINEKRFFPICRFSDGEFLLLLGEQPIDIRLSFIQKARQLLMNLKSRFLLKGGIGPFTRGHYHSGKLSQTELVEQRNLLPKIIKKIGEKGILALHLNYVNEPFAERYYPELANWLETNNIEISYKNYFPFYFVYASLVGPRRFDILRGRRVLIINGANGGKQLDIINNLKKNGVSEVYWCSISLTRSMYDVIDIKPYLGKIDLIFIGAGIGKPNIILQLEPLNVPCIDAGYVFEVWANPLNKYKRVWCASDDDWEFIKSTPTKACLT
jgi:hypothetical protein